MMWSWNLLEVVNVNAVGPITRPPPAVTVNASEIFPRSMKRYSAFAVHPPQRCVSTPPPTVQPPLVRSLDTPPIVAPFTTRSKSSLISPHAPPPVTYQSQSPLV